MLLRAASGAIVLYQSGIDLFAGSNATLATWVVELLFVAAGILLIIGLLTPVAAVLLGVLEIVTHSFFGSANCSLSGCTSSTAFTAALAAAIVILGPGALSMDARLFGLREIIIPAARVGGSPDRRSER